MPSLVFTVTGSYILFLNMNGIHIGCMLIKIIQKEKNETVRKINKHYIDTYGALDRFVYKDFIPMFTAEKFDLVEWHNYLKMQVLNFLDRF